MSWFIALPRRTSSWLSPYLSGYMQQSPLISVYITLYNRHRIPNQRVTSLWPAGAVAERWGQICIIPVHCYTDARHCILYYHIYTCIYTDALQWDANETVEGYRNVDFPFFERLDQQLQSLSMILNDILDLALHHSKMLSNIVFSRVALRKGQLRELFVDSQLHNCTFVFVKGTLCIVHCILYNVYCVYVCECYVRRNGQLKAFMNISRVEGRRRRLTQVNRHHRHYNPFRHNDWCQIILLNQIADTSDIADISWIAVLFQSMTVIYCVKFSFFTRKFFCTQ